MIGYTAAQVAAMLQTPESTIKNLAMKREIPFLMVGGKYRFTDRHIQEIVELLEHRPEQAYTTTAPRRATTKPADSAVTPLQARRPKRRRSA